MTNGEKFKTPKERAEAFCDGWMHDHPLKTVANPVLAAFEWLDIEAPEEKLLTCPFCGCACTVNHGTRYGELYQVICMNEICGYDSQLCGSKDAAIAAHNRVARAAKEKEANNER